MLWDKLEDCSSPPKSENTKIVNWDKLQVCPKDYKEGDFDFRPLIGNRVLRANINTYRIHILHHFAKEMFGQDNVLTDFQDKIDSGEITPSIKPEENLEAFTVAMATIVKFVDRIEVVYQTKNKLHIYMKTSTQNELEKLGSALHLMGVNLKYELAQKDEINTEENTLRWKMCEWAKEHSKGGR